MFCFVLFLFLFFSRSDVVAFVPYRYDVFGVFVKLNYSSSTHVDFMGTFAVIVVESHRRCFRLLCVCLRMILLCCVSVLFSSTTTTVWAPRWTDSRSTSSWSAGPATAAPGCPTSATRSPSAARTPVSVETLVHVVRVNHYCCINNELLCTYVLFCSCSCFCFILFFFLAIGLSLCAGLLMFRFRIRYFWHCWMDRCRLLCILRCVT